MLDLTVDFRPCPGKFDAWIDFAGGRGSLITYSLKHSSGGEGNLFRLYYNAYLSICGI